jgi:putative transposase
MSNNLDHGHRFPPEIISHCVWLYNCFALSYRDIEKMMLDRGIEVTYEAIRKLMERNIFSGELWMKKDKS